MLLLVAWVKPRVILQKFYIHVLAECVCDIVKERREKKDRNRVVWRRWLWLRKMRTRLRVQLIIVEVKREREWGGWRGWVREKCEKLFSSRSVTWSVQDQCTKCTRDDVISAPSNVISSWFTRWRPLNVFEMEKKQHNTNQINDRRLRVLYKFSVLFFCFLPHLGGFGWWKIYKSCMRKGDMEVAAREKHEKCNLNNSKVYPREREGKISCSFSLPTSFLSWPCTICLKLMRCCFEAAQRALIRSSTKRRLN